MKLSDCFWIQTFTNMSGIPISCMAARAEIGNYIVAIYNLGMAVPPAPIANIVDIDSWTDIQIEVAHHNKLNNSLNKILTVEEYSKIPEIKAEYIYTTGSVFLYRFPFGFAENVVNYCAGNKCSPTNNKPEERSCCVCQRPNYLDATTCWWCGNKPFHYTGG